MSPPLIQCCYGHHECSRCIERSEECYTCNTIRIAKRDHFLEKLCFNTILKCSFATEGCIFSDKALQVAAHEFVCTFKVKQSIANGAYNTVGGVVDQPSELEDGYHSRTVEEGPSKPKAGGGKNSSGELLEDIVASTLECPVCLTRILPPITECHNGHRICIDCYHRIENCPVCRGPKCLGTNEFLMQIFDKLEISCKNSGNGCHIRQKGPSIVDHEMSCAFVFEPCPLTNGHGCKWIGLQTDLIDHCKINHSDVISLKSESEWKTYNFNPHLKYFHLIYVHGVLFKCCWQMFKGLKIFYLKHLNIGSVKRYNFDMKILMTERGCVAHLSGGFSHPVKSLSIPITTRSYIRINQSIIPNLCDSDGFLSYAVTINEC
ncbi:uncharacterized protein isoform X2 [Leptinotarsa decemlineata]